MSDKFVTFNADGTLSHRLIKGIHAIPEEAIPVDEAMWFRLTQEIDGLWVFDAEGRISKRSLPIIEPDLAAIERLWRDGELASLIWLRDRHRDQLDIGTGTTLGAEKFSELLVYMQALRDWPQSPDFPDIGQRPVPPAWIAEQTQ